MEIGERIAELRNSYGWTRAYVAKHIGTNSRSVENWENGISTSSIENLVKLCRVFHTTPDALLGFSSKSVLVIDDLPQEDQFALRGIFQVFWDRNKKYR